MSAPSVNLKNLERIHETAGSASSRIATLALAGVGLAAVVTASTLLADRSSGQVDPAADPLAALVKTEAARSQAEDTLRADELGFPEVLSDAEERTTALVAVRGPRGQLVTQEEPADQPAPEPAGAPEGLSVAPRALGSLLAATSVTSQPKDDLTELAVRSSSVAEPEVPTPSGVEGGFLVQVASFKVQEDADALVLELKKRGHRAFRQPANVPGRGLWHRVRIGSFKSHYEATLYKAKLEETERMVTLVIDPDKVLRQEQTRALKLAESIRKYGTP